MIMVTDAQKKATRKYQEKTYDRMELQLKKGKKAIYREHAESIGYSLNGLINELLELEMTNPRITTKSDSFQTSGQK